MQVDTNKTGCKVDQSDMEDGQDDLKNCEVVQSEIHSIDGENMLYYDTALIKVDVKASYYGVNGFYVIQLLRDIAKDLYILWTRWGRIGD